MTTKENTNSKVHFLSDTKKKLILNLDLINYRLDIFRTNINIVKYNLTENDKIADNKLPNFNFEEANKLLSLFGNILNGTIKDYKEMIEIVNQQLNKPILDDVNKNVLKKQKEEKKEGSK